MTSRFTIANGTAIAAIFAALSIATMPASATEKPSSGKAAENAQRDDTGNPKQRYCIIETPTGSHLPRKVCMTRGEWLDRGFDPLNPR